MSPMLHFAALRCTSSPREDVDGTVVLFPAPGAAPAADLTLAPRRIVVLDGGQAGQEATPKFQIVAMRRNFRDIPPGWAQCKKMNEWLDPALPRSLN